MILLVNAENRRHFQADLVDMHRQRKTVFVDGAEWRIPVSGDPSWPKCVGSLAVLHGAGDRQPESPPCAAFRNHRRCDRDRPALRHRAGHLRRQPRLPASPRPPPCYAIARRRASTLPSRSTGEPAGHRLGSDPPLPLRLAQPVAGISPYPRSVPPWLRQPR